MALFEHGVLIVQGAIHYVEQTVTTTATGLTEIPERPPVRRILIHNVGDVVRWVAVSGMDPTGSFGDTLDADDILVFDGPPEDITFVLDDTATDSSTLRIHYFGAT